MLRIAGYFLVLFILTSTGISQINIQWEARLDGTGSFTDNAVDLELDASGNTYVTGSSYSGTSFDLVTVKYDADGAEVWRSSYGGTGLDEASALVLDNNNDVIVTGYRTIGAGDVDIVTVKYDGVTGAELWSVIYSGSSGFDFGTEIAVDGSNNVIVVGTYYVGVANTDFVTIKYNSSGVEQWDVITGGGGNDDAGMVETDASGNVYVGGRYENTLITYFDFQVIKYNSLGVEQWSTIEDSGYGNLDSPFAMTLDGSNDIIIAGSGFTDIWNEEDYLTMKFDNATGSLDWKELYAGDAEALDVINAVAVDGSNNVYVTGKSKSVETSEDYYTIAYDIDGTEIWSQRYTTEGLEYDEATDIKVADSDTYVYVSGYSFYAATNNDFTTIKYDITDGTQEWLTIFDGPSSNSDQALKMELDASENVFITGNSHGGATNLDYSTIKYCQLTTAASPDTAICIGESVTLNATGGSDVTWSVLSGDAASMSCTVCETMVATPTETTVYTVSSISLSGCVDYDTVTVQIYELPTPTIYNDTPLDFCDGGEVTLYTDTYMFYDWTGGSVDSFAVVTTGGTVTLTVTDLNGCIGSTDAEVTVYDLPVVDAGEDLAICIDGSIGLSVTGATTYVWDFDPTLSVLLGPSPTASPTVDTEYYVTGTDDNGCENRDTVVVVVNGLPSVNAGSDANICVGDSVQLEATGATSYLWDSHPSLSDLGIADPWASPISITEYFVTGTDDNGCSNIDSVIVSTTSIPIISAGEDTVVCAGGSVQIFASGGLPDMYVWNDDPTISETDVFNPFVSPVTGTDYIVTGTDVNGCSNTDTVFVDVYDLPSVFAGDDDAICVGDSLQLEASGALVYTWDSDPSLSAFDIPDPWAKPLATKTYTVTGVDENECINSDEVVITVNELPDISAGIDAEICEGDSTQLNATGGEIYVWDFDPTLSNFVIGDPWAKPAVTTIYIVEGTDANGCSNSDEVEVVVNPTPTPPVLTTTDGGLIISSYETGNQWYFEEDELAGETNDTLDYNEIGMNGEYWVLYTDEHGCSVTSDRIDNPTVIIDVGIQEENSFVVKLYPNPAQSTLFIEVETGLDVINVYDMNGRLVLQYTNVPAGVNQVDLNDFMNGTYMIQMIQGESIVTKKLIKQ